MFTPCSSVSIVNFEHVIAGWGATFNGAKYLRMDQVKLLEESL